MLQNSKYTHPGAGFNHLLAKADDYFELKNVKPPRLNKQIFEYFSFFTDDQDSLLLALIQNPLAKNSDGDLKIIKKQFGKNVYQKALMINDLHDQKSYIVDDYDKCQNVGLLFLINYKFILDNKLEKEAESLFTQKSLEYLLRIIEKCHASKIRDELEDRIFELFASDIFHHYEKLLSFTKKTYSNLQKKTKKELEKILEKRKIQGIVESRLKSIYSTHKKINKKNVLFSQVLDLIGFRIIVNTTNDCYRTMEALLPLMNVLNTKIKDYITLPKKNGYQSIHLTVIIDGHPVEIQIRTKKMHHHAEYGPAAHHLYKTQ